MAQIGSRVVEGVAKKMADDFFSTFVQQVSPTITDIDSENTNQNNPDVPSSKNSDVGIPAWAWVIGLIVLVGTGLFLYS